MIRRLEMGSFFVNNLAVMLSSEHLPEPCRIGC
ncbi:hypothetical protein PUN4_370073 [Paraburkholderia unamae]|nr:hypothetical protein PUN4_370073 [Paraburkholderia unamae]